jgi:hypothetical protein
VPFFACFPFSPVDGQLEPARVSPAAADPDLRLGGVSFFSSFFIFFPVFSSPFASKALS